MAATTDDTHDGTPRVDARVRRTRQRLEDAIIDLCNEGDYNVITIEDVLRRADVSRPAFYSHYADKDALLDAALERALEALRSESGAAMNRDGTLVTGPTEVLFRSALEHAPAMRALLSGAGNGRPLRLAMATTAKDMEPALARQAAEAGTTPRLPIDLIAAHWVSSFFTVLQWWLDDRLHLSPATVANHFLNITLRGRAWALGFDIAQHEISQLPPTGDGSEAGVG